MGSRYDDYDDFDDYDDRPRRRRRRPRRRAGSGANVGKVLGIIAGVFAAIGVIVALVLILRERGYGGGSINFAQYQAIGATDTIESLEKKHGRGRKIDPREWDTTAPGLGNNQPRGMSDGFGWGTGTTLYGFNSLTREVTAWYVWRKGREEVYVAEGTDRTGRRGLVVKVYMNRQVLEDSVLKHAPAPHEWFTFQSIEGGARMEFGFAPSNP